MAQLYNGILEGLNESSEKPPNIYGWKESFYYI